MAKIATVPTPRTFQPGTTAGHIFSKRSVLMALQPGEGSHHLLSMKGVACEKSNLGTRNSARYGRDKCRS